MLRNLEKLMGPQIRVIDRSGLILDIFDRRARTREARTQVELAQMEYMLPRLRGWGQSMSRQAGGRVAGGGGIGTRGPGETKIETDRRRIRNRKAKLAAEIKQMKTARDTKRQERLRGERYDPSDVWVIGDTANDLACARAGGVRCLLVGTGLGYDAVRDLDADHVVPDLSDVDAVVDVLTG